MPRSVNHVASKQRRKKVLKMAKGYFGRRKNVWTVAKNAVEKALTYAYRDRKQKRRNVRSVWIVRINAAVREYDMSYSEFIGKLNAKNITLSRKALADLAMNHPDAFKAIVNEVKDAIPVSRPDNAPRAKNVANVEAPKAKTAAPKAEAKTAKKEVKAEIETPVVETPVVEAPAEDASADEAPVKKTRAKAKKADDDSSEDK
jgi:large subunit ribosomal protein L20